MCLLKPGQTNSQCMHGECQKFYMLNRQMCLHNMTQTLNKASPKQSASETPEDTRTHQNPLSPNKMMNILGKGAQINIKRSLATRSDVSTDEESEFSLNKKKVKAEATNLSPETTPTPLNTFVPAQNNIFGINNINSALFANSLNAANNIKMVQNQRADGFANSSPALLSMLQNMQPNLLANTQPSLPFGGLPYGLNGLNLQQYSQSINKKPETVLSAESVETKNSSQSFEEMFNEFQSKTLGFLFNQNKMLCDLNEKNELVQDTLACLISEITALKSLISGTSQDKPLISKQSKSSIAQQPLNCSSESINSEDLMTFLYGNKSDFEYQLVLDGEFSLPLYRERNFEFNVKLADKNGKPVENSNKIPLTLSVYTCENPPKYVDSNTAGNKIFKGFTEKDLTRGGAGFEKIQIKEVTSHFRNGWIFLVVHPKVNGNSNVFQGKDGLIVDAQKIKPLILEKVIVKAKKTKEKDDFEVKTLNE